MVMDDFIFETGFSTKDLPMLSPPNGHQDCIPHFHRQVEIMYCLTGHVKAIINGEEHVLTEDTLAVADSYDIHSWTSINGLAICLVIPWSKLTLYNELKGTKKLSRNFIFDKEKAVKVKELITVLYKYYEKPPSDSIVADGLMKAIVGLITELIPLSDNVKIKDPYIHEILIYIDNNFKNDLTLDVLAEHFKYNKYHFSKLFNKYLGCHLTDYVNMTRTYYVIKQLQETDTSVIDAILESGFTSVPTFYRFFKKRYGCGILTYLRKIKNGKQ